MSGKYRALLALIKEMRAHGKTQQQIATELGLASKKVVWNFGIVNGKKASKVCPNFVAANRQRPCRSTNAKASD